MASLRRIAGFATLCFIWGTSWVAFSELQDHCPPYRAAAIRYAIASLVLLGIAAAKRKPIPRGRPFWSMLILGVTMVALPFALFLWAGHAIPVATGAVVFALAPIALALLSSAGRGVPVPRAVFYATLGGFGAMVLAMSGALSFPMAHLAQLVATGAAVASVTGSFVLAKNELQDSSPLYSAGIQLAVAAVLLGCSSGVMERGQPSQWTSESLLALGLLSVVGSAVALPLFYWLLQRSEPAGLSTVEWMQPLISVAEGAALLHQPVRLTFWLGSAGVISCIGIMLASTKEQPVTLSLRASSAKNDLDPAPF